MIRGDEILSSLMEEMAGDNTSSNITTKNEKQGTSSTDRIRMVPEIQGYGDNHTSCPENGRDGNIWNPYVRTQRDSMLHLANDESQVPPTNPLVEIARRRAYEKFKKEFYATFQWNAQHAAAAGKESTNEHANILRLWQNIPPHSILERWYFACKLEESLRMVPLRKDEGKVPCINRDTLGIATTRSIRNILVHGRQSGSIMDPILLTQLQAKGKREGSDTNLEIKDRMKNHTHFSSGTLFQNEIKFQFIREWKKSKHKKEDTLFDFFSSSKFFKKCQKIIRDVNNVAISVESDFHANLLKTSDQLEVSISRKGRKRGIPKVAVSSSSEGSTASTESLVVTHHGLSFKISQVHYRKLQILFDRNNWNNSSLGDHRDAFHCHLFSLLARYDMLEGAGLQSSLSGNVFDVLLKHFQCNMECFASPFNCRYESFCSAFPDTDSPFGSLGSFFNFNFESLTSGACFQANPPFAADFILAMQRRMEVILTKDLKIPLMFIVFVPAWIESKGWESLRDCEVCAHHLFLSQKDDPHYYCEGTQYRRSKRYRMASFDTSIFFLQNEVAKKEWPISSSAIDELKIAFRCNPDDGTEKIDGTASSISERKVNKRKPIGGKNDPVESFIESKSTPNKLISTRPEKPTKTTNKKKRRKLMTDSGEEQLRVLSSLGLASSVDSCIPGKRGKKDNRKASYRKERR